MRTGSIVVVTLHSPRERFFGRLLELTTAGTTVRGIDLNAFDDWTSQVAGGETFPLQPTTVFYPITRIEKILLDEPVGPVHSLAQSFMARAGKPVEEYLETT